MISRLLFDPAPTIHNGQHLIVEGFNYFVMVDGVTKSNGKCYDIDEDLFDLTREQLQIEIMKLRNK